MLSIRKLVLAAACLGTASGVFAVTNLVVKKASYNQDRQEISIEIAYRGIGGEEFNVETSPNHNYSSLQLKVVEILESENIIERMGTPGKPKGTKPLSNSGKMSKQRQKTARQNELRDERAERLARDFETQEQRIVIPHVDKGQEVLILQSESSGHLINIKAADPEKLLQYLNIY